MPQSVCQGSRLTIGPSGEGLWIVCDETGVCGAVFKDREQALHFARAECEASGRSEWRLVASLEMGAIFARAH